MSSARRAIVILVPVWCWVFVAVTMFSGRMIAHAVAFGAPVPGAAVDCAWIFSFETVPKLVEVLFIVVKASMSPLPGSKSIIGFVVFSFRSVASMV